MPTSLLRAGPLAADFVSGTNRPTFAVRNGHKVAVFLDAGTTETFYTFNMPTVFASGDIEVKLTWMADIAVGGDTVWEVAFERHELGVDDLDSDSFAAGISFVSAADVTPGIPSEAVIPVTAAQYDGIAQGDQFRLAVRRLGDDSSDGMSGDAQLMTVVIEQSADPAGGGGGFFSDGAGTRAGIGQGSPVPTATGIEGLSHGTSASAAGDYSLAFCRNAETGPAANLSVALGDGAKIFGPNGVALGRNAGHASSVEADRVNIGYGANAEGVDGIAIGSGAHTTAAQASGIAIGDAANVEFANGIALGTGARSEAPDHICIGRNFTANTYTASNDLISIGRNHVNAVYIAPRAIMIGYNNLVGRTNILLGSYLNVSGQHNILIGRKIAGDGGQDYQDLWNNVCLDPHDSYFSGLDNGGGGTLYNNIVMNTGSNPGGCRSYNGNNQNENIVFSTGNTFIYGDTKRSILLGRASTIGDFNNQAPDHYDNILIGNSCYIATYGGATDEATANILMGEGSRIEAPAQNCVVLGVNCAIYPHYDAATNGVFVAGKYCEANGVANVAMGVYTYSDYGSSMTSSTSHRGNLAIGYNCKSQPTADAPWRSTIAQGVGTKAFVGGHRAFSAADMATGAGGESNPNQGGWAVDHVETTDATQTTIFTFPTSADKAYALSGFVVARRTDADGFNAVFSLSNTLVYRNAAGGPVLVGDPKAWVQDSNQGAPAWTIDISIATNDIVVRVTGIAAQTVEWLVWLDIFEVRG